MAYLIKVASNTTYWSGDENSVWVDQAAQAKSYAKKADANAEVETIAEAWGYTLEVVDAKDAPSAEVPEVEVEEAPVIPPLAGVPADWTQERIAPGAPAEA